MPVVSIGLLLSPLPRPLLFLALPEGGVEAGPRAAGLRLGLGSKQTSSRHRAVFEKLVPLGCGLGGPFTLRSFQSCGEELLDHQASQPCPLLPTVLISQKSSLVSRQEEETCIRSRGLDRPFVRSFVYSFIHSFPFVHSLTTRGTPCAW